MLNTLAVELEKVNKALAKAKEELAEWEKLDWSDPNVRSNKTVLTVWVMRFKSRQVRLQNMIENKRADLQAREFEAMNRYERGLDS